MRGGRSIESAYSRIAEDAVSCLRVGCAARVVCVNMPQVRLRKFARRADLPEIPRKPVYEPKETSQDN